MKVIATTTKDSVVKLQVREICSTYIHGFEQSELDVIVTVFEHFTVCISFACTYVGMFHDNYGTKFLYSACIRMTLL